jgi:predicted integral membrane protein DUF2269
MTEIFIFLHVASAIVFIGELMFASLWLRSAVARGEDLPVARYVISTMRLTSRGVAFPAIVVQLISGLALMHFREVHFSRAIWLWVSIALFTVVASMWHGTLIPLRKKLERLLEGGAAGPLPAEYGPIAKRWVSVSRTVLVLIGVILVLMVWRPVLS